MKPILKADMKTLNQLPLVKRKKARALLLDIMRGLKKQNEFYHELFLEPNERAIQFVDDTLKRNQKTNIMRSVGETEYCLQQTRARYKEIHKLFEGNNSVKKILRKANKINKRHLYTDHNDFNELHDFIKELAK